MNSENIIYSINIEIIVEDYYKTNKHLQQQPIIISSQWLYLQ